MRLSPELIEELTSDQAAVQDLGTPTVFEIEHMLELIRKRHPVDAWNIRRQLKWLIRVVEKEYNLQFTTPWKKRRA